MNNIESNFPGLYKAAGKVSMDAQSQYYQYLGWYLSLLITAALISYLWPENQNGAFFGAVLFLVTLAILIYLNIYKPDNAWYTGRAVAESVKTRSWRWIMGAEPYSKSKDDNVVAKEFVNDLRAIKNVNKIFADGLGTTNKVDDVISKEMLEIRQLEFPERLEYYKTHRIQNQADWYAKKAVFNKRKSKFWFVVSIGLHALAILMLLYKIEHPSLDLPVEVITTAAGAVLTWLQAKKHNELVSSYSLTAHEIVLIKGEALSVSETEFSDFIVNSEAAFSREHTQWVARKID